MKKKMQASHSFLDLYQLGSVKKTVIVPLL